CDWSSDVCSSDLVTQDPLHNLNRACWPRACSQGLCLVHTSARLCGCVCVCVCVCICVGGCVCVCLLRFVCLCVSRFVCLSVCVEICLSMCVCGYLEGHLCVVSLCV